MSSFKFQWVPHNGGPMPVSAETYVVIRIADVGEFWGEAQWLEWRDVVAYRVVEVRP